MEIEAKYRVQTPADLDRVAELTELGGYVLRPHAAAEQQRNDYYDTADRRLQAAARRRAGAGDAEGAEQPRRRAV
jgi:inorganic triphosphatase YgiF